MAVFDPWTDEATAAARAAGKHFLASVEGQASGLIHKHALRPPPDLTLLDYALRMGFAGYHERAALQGRRRQTHSSAPSEGDLEGIPEAMREFFRPRQQVPFEVEGRNYPFPRPRAVGPCRRNSAGTDGSLHNLTTDEGIRRMTQPLEGLPTVAWAEASAAAFAAEDTKLEQWVQV